MAEPLRHKKISIHDILEEMEKDEIFSKEEVEAAREKALELEYKQWCARQIKSEGA